MKYSIKIDGNRVTRKGVSGKKKIWEIPHSYIILTELHRSCLGNKPRSPRKRRRNGGGGGGGGSTLQSSTYAPLSGYKPKETIKGTFMKKKIVSYSGVLTHHTYVRYSYLYLRYGFMIYLQFRLTKDIR